MEDMNCHLSSAVPQAIELNKHNFPNFAYISPEQWSQIHKPQQLKMPRSLIKNKLRQLTQ